MPTLYVYISIILSIKILQWFQIKELQQLRPHRVVFFVNSQVFSEVDSMLIPLILGGPQVVPKSFQDSNIMSLWPHFISMLPNTWLDKKNMFTSVAYHHWHLENYALAPAKSYNSQLLHAFTKLLGTILSWTIFDGFVVLWPSDGSNYTNTDRILFLLITYE